LVCEDVEFVSANGNTQIIGISKKHSEETFARNKDLFTKFLREFFGNESLNFELKRIERKNSPAIIAQSSSSNGHAKASPGVTIDDHVERTDLELALIKEMGAIPVG